MTHCATKKTITAKKSATLLLKKKSNGKKIVLSKSSVTVSTSKKTVATVKKVLNKAGKVKNYKVSAKKAGKATITIKVKKGTYKGTYKCKVTVKADAAPKTSAKPSTAPSQAPATNAPTDAPATDAPATDAPATDAPATEAPSAKPTANPDEFKVSAVKVLTSTKVNVTFSKAVDATTAASNFKLDGGASVSGVELSEDRTVVTLSLNGVTAGKEYTLTITGVTSGDAKIESAEQKFTAIADEYSLLLDDGIEEGNVLKADGTTSTNVKVSLVNANGDVVKDADKVELKFDTTAGNFANKTVTVQDGVAENTFTSESLVAAKTALITVTIVNAADSKLINVYNTMNIVMDPNPVTSVDDSVGATLTDVKVQTADKVALFFNKVVNVTDYTFNNKNNDWAIYNYDANKMAITVTDGATKSTVPVYGLSAVEGNDKALYAHLGTPVNYGTSGLKQLTDNAKITVEVTDKTKKQPVSDKKEAVLQDITAPSVLSVTNDGLTKIILTFSEAVNPIPSSGDANAFKSSAANIENYMIDGVPLKNVMYGDVNYSTTDQWGNPLTGAATAVPGIFDVYSGSDNKNVVEITLGKDANGKQIYLPAGRHSIQISNVGDAANVSDLNSNKLVTQSLDFNIVADDKLVGATAEVQSPEQYVITLDRKAAGDVVSLLNSNLKLQKWDSATSQYVNVADPAIAVRADNNSNGLKYIVETQKDWTKVYDTATNHKNYYNDQYRLYLPKDVLENPGNGKKNVEISMLLDNEMMKNPDVTSPEIKDVSMNSDKKTFNISLSEPVQVVGMTGTPTPDQKQNTNAGIPVPNVAFIKSDNSVTIPATITGVGTYHNTITVRPTDDLSAGTWKVAVYSISDDIGNTAATLVKDNFVIESQVVSVDNSFRPLWIVAVPSGQTDPLTGGSNANNDVVYIRYSQSMATAGSSANATSTANYQVNGYSIPVSTKMSVVIDGYNDEVSKVYGVNAMKDTLAIYLNKNTLAGKSNNLSIAPTIESAKGNKIENAGLKTLDKSGSIFVWNYKTVADGVGSVSLDTVDKVKAALADGSNVNITTAQLTGAAAEAADLTIDKAMTVDFGTTGNNSTIKSLKIETQATGKIVVKNLTATAITINAPNADVEFEGVIANVTSTNDAVVTLKNVLKTVKLDATTAFDILNITSDVKHNITVQGASGASITTVNNDAGANATVTIDPLTITTLNQNTAGKVILEDVTITDFNVKAAASVELAGSNTITNTNVAKNVKIEKLTGGTTSDLGTIKVNVEFAADGTVSAPGDTPANDDAVVKPLSPEEQATKDAADMEAQIDAADTPTKVSAARTAFDALSAAAKEKVAAAKVTLLETKEAAATAVSAAKTAAGTTATLSTGSATAADLKTAVTTAIDNADITVAVTKVDTNTSPANDTAIANGNVCTVSLTKDGVTDTVDITVTVS